MKTRAILSAVTSILILSGCGFQPMYGTYAASGSEGAREALQAIEIANIPDRDGQILRNELLDRFNYQNGGPTNPRYKLVFKNLAARSHDLDLTKDSESTRSQMTVSGNFDLIDLQTQQVVLTRKVSSVSSHNILASEFATRVTEISARENAIRDIARQVTQQISLHFNR